VSAYSNGGPKPARDVAQAALDELLVNIRLENTVFFPDVVNALLRQAPVRVEGENFGREGRNKSYGVIDASRRSPHYRQSEPVMVQSQRTNRRQSEQYVILKATEWTAYTIASKTPKAYAITVKAKSSGATAEARLIVGDQVRSVTLSPNGWSEIKLEPVSLAQGTNRLQWMVKSGVVDLDWLELNPAENSQAASADPQIVPR
jgi:hypothetical protein